MLASLQPGLTARLDYVVRPERTVPHLLPESDDANDDTPSKPS
ncbi:hypothetical protein [Actinomadura decatromicini]|nr:hypothetical protein [Actinomadura decatromicini]